VPSTAGSGAATDRRKEESGYGSNKKITLAYALRLVTASMFIAISSGVAHLAMLGKAGKFAVPFVILSVLGAGLSLWGRFDWTRVGQRFLLFGHLLRETAGTSTKLAAFASGLMWIAFGTALARIVWMIFGSWLIRLGGGPWELLGWCGLIGAAMCWIKGGSDWSLAFKGATGLENEHVHGDARLATENEAAAAARGASRPRQSRGGDLNY
jgi:hypothetical protein